MKAAANLISYFSLLNFVGEIGLEEDMLNRYLYSIV